MYTSYWGLQEKPFENTPNPKFLYRCRHHNEALARLLYVVQEKKGAVLLTGEVGSGKTLLTRILWQELQQSSHYQSVFVLNPRLNALEFIQEIASQLGMSSAKDAQKIELFHFLHKTLYENFNTGTHTIIVIDEAQAIADKDIFEELRLLLNFQLDNAFLLTLIMLGQPELSQMINSLTQFNQRVAVRFHLSALNALETKEYICTRMNIAGASHHEVFSAGSLDAIYILSGGIPRVINNICDLALLAGSGSNLPEINREVIIEVGKDLGIAIPEELMREDIEDPDLEDADLNKGLREN